MRSQWILIEFSHKGRRKVEFGSGWNAMIPTVARVDKGVKRQHEYILHAAPPEGAFYVDILTRLGEAFRFEDLETQRLPFEGLLVTVVTPRQLYLMKKDTVRPKDRMDAEALRRKFGLPDD